MSIPKRDGLSYGKYLVSAIPSILSMVFLSFYTTIDGFFVSYAVGADALAAINIALPITSIIFGLAVMLATGAGAIIGERLGAGEKKEARSLFSFVSAMLLAITAVLTVLGLILLKPLAKVLGSTERLDPYVIPYLAIIIIGTIPMAFKLFFEYMVRTDDHPKIALVTSTLGLIFNVVFDWLFVVVLGMGTAGAGLGTLMSILVGTLIGLVHFMRGRNIRYTKFTCEWKDLAKSCSNGSSEMLSELSVGITTFLFNIIILSYYGEEGVAAVTIITYVYYFFIAFYMGLGVASAPKVSFSLGERNFARIRTILKYALITLLTFSAVIWAFAFFSAPITTSLFLHEGDPSLTIYGLKVSSFVFMFAGFNIFLSAYFTAIGDGFASALISTLRSLILVVPLVIFLPKLFGADAIWLTLPLADALTIFVSGYLFNKRGRVKTLITDRKIDIKKLSIASSNI